MKILGIIFIIFRLIFTVLLTFRWLAGDGLWWFSESYFIFLGWFLLFYSLFSDFPGMAYDDFRNHILHFYVDFCCSTHFSVTSRGWPMMIFWFIFIIFRLIFAVLLTLSVTSRGWPMMIFEIIFIIFRLIFAVLLTFRRLPGDGLWWFSKSYLLFLGWFLLFYSLYGDFPGLAYDDFPNHIHYFWVDFCCSTHFSATSRGWPMMIFGIIFIIFRLIFAVLLTFRRLPGDGLWWFSESYSLFLGWFLLFYSLFGDFPGMAYDDFQNHILYFKVNFCCSIHFTVTSRGWPMMIFRIIFIIFKLIFAVLLTFWNHIYYLFCWFLLLYSLFGDFPGLACMVAMTVKAAMERLLTYMLLTRYSASSLKLEKLRPRSFCAHSQMSVRDASVVSSSTGISGDGWNTKQQHYKI